MNRAIIAVVLVIHLTASAVQTIGSVHPSAWNFGGVVAMLFPGVIITSWIAGFCEVLALIALSYNMPKWAMFCGTQGFAFDLLTVIAIAQSNVPSSVLVASILWLFAFVVLSLSNWIKSVAVEGDT